MTALPHIRTAHKSLIIPYNGIPLCAFSSISDQQYLMNHYHTKPNDVYLISYPKAGQHWLKKICIELINHHDKQNTHAIYSTGDIGMNAVPWKETFFTQGGKDAFDQRVDDLKDCLNLWWTHNPYSLFPANKANLHPDTRYIVINRNPKDILISYWYFMNALDANWGGFDPQMSLNAFFFRFIAGTCHFGCVYSWTLDWFNAYNDSVFNNNEQMLWIYYEDLLDNPFDNVKKVKEFLYPDDDVITDDDINAVVNASMFKNMKQDLLENPQSMSFTNEHFRCGEANDWKRHLSQEQSDLLDELMWIKWADGGTNIKYYSDVMTKYAHVYNFGYH
eukprot:23068_1